MKTQKLLTKDLKEISTLVKNDFKSDLQNIIICKTDIVYTRRKGNIEVKSIHTYIL